MRARPRRGRSPRHRAASPRRPCRRAQTLASGSAPSTASRPPMSTSSRRRAREAERRQVTVLVCGCDLFESEAYLERPRRRGPGRGAARPSSGAASKACCRFDGTVVQCNERGAAGLLRLPGGLRGRRALRALRAGLGLLEDLKALGERLRRAQLLELDPWVGIHTGSGHRGGGGGGGLAGGGGAQRGGPAGGRRRTPARSSAPRPLTG